MHGLYSELVDNVGRSGTLLRDWRGFSAGADADDVLREIEGAFGETEDSRVGTVLGAYAEDTFMSPIYAAEDAARDVTPLTPWENENGVAFLSRTLDADAGAVVPCLWYCRRDEGQGFEVGGVKLDCSKIGFDEVAAAAASNGLDSVLAYLEDSPRGLEPLCDIAVRRADGGQADAVKHFGNQGEAMAMLSAITGCRIQAYGTDTLIYRASLGSSAAAKLAAGALAMKDYKGCLLCKVFLDSHDKRSCSIDFMSGPHASRDRGCRVVGDKVSLFDMVERSFLCSDTHGFYYDHPVQPLDEAHDFADAILPRFRETISPSEAEDYIYMRGEFDCNIEQNYELDQAVYGLKDTHPEVFDAFANAPKSPYASPCVCKCFCEEGYRVYMSYVLRPGTIAGKPYAELAALEAERCIPADIRKDCEVECFCPDESEFTFMNVYLPTVGSDFALSPNDSQNLIDRIDLSLESRFRNKLYPAGEFKNYLIKERLFDLHDSENTNDLLMATTMAKWDVDHGATDSEHVARYHELLGALKEELGIVESRAVSVQTDVGELVATPFAGGIGVDINLPDGKGSGQLAFIESTPAELQDDYPTPVHVFSYDGRDSEPVHRTDVHLDGDAMTLDPVKGTPAHNGAQAHGGDKHPADLAKAASAAANRTAGSHADEAGGIKH